MSSYKDLSISMQDLLSDSQKEDIDFGLCHKLPFLIVSRHGPTVLATELRRLGAKVYEKNMDFITIELDWPLPVHKETSEEQKEFQASLEALQIYENARLAEETHAYLTKKGIKPYGLRQYGDKLLAPFRDVTTYDFRTIQTISPTGEKQCYKGAPKLGAVYSLGNDSNNRMILVCEGVATAHTLYELTGHFIIACGDCGNLRISAMDIRNKYNEHRIIVAADNDYRKEKNTGIRFAKAACELGKFDGYIYPAFNPDEDGSDWNDYFLIHGREETAKEIRRQIDEVIGYESSDAEAEFDTVIPDSLSHKESVKCDETC